MKLKASHHWTDRGDVVVTIRDHDVVADDTFANRKLRTVEVVERFHYPRGLAGKELRDLKRALVRAVELRKEVAAC